MGANELIQEMATENLVNALVSGVISGALYAAMALGLTIIYGVSRVFNFGHGVVALIGAYIAWVLMENAGLSLLPSMFISTGFMVVFGWVVYKLTISPLMKKPNWEFSTVIFMLGAGILLENIVLQIFGPRVKSIPSFFEGSVKIAFVNINLHEISLIVLVVLWIYLLNAFFKHTRTGQAMRAVAQSIPGAQVVGIDIWLYLWFSICGHWFQWSFVRNKVLFKSSYWMGMDG